MILNGSYNFLKNPKYEWEQIYTILTELLLF